ncbi:MAG: hypothetical protein IPF79_04690 [Ignavibacteria bacterium]|nr:hypothetical protein [Ignavibacteria bacterium]
MSDTGTSDQGERTPEIVGAPLGFPNGREKKKRNRGANVRTEQRRIVDEPIIAEMWARKKTVREITEYLNENIYSKEGYSVTPENISFVINRMKANWRTRRDDAIEEKRNALVNELEAVKRAAWQGWELSQKTTMSKRIQKDKLPKQIEELLIEATGTGDYTAAMKLLEKETTDVVQRDGNPEFLRIIAECIAKEADMHGIGKPDKDEAGNNLNIFMQQRVLLGHRVMNNESLSELATQLAYGLGLGSVDTRVDGNVRIEGEMEERQAPTPP